MKFYLDSAEIENIKKAAKLGYLCGVTTNPSLLKKARVWEKFENLTNFYAEILQITHGLLFVQLPSEGFEPYLKSLEELDRGRIVVKIPSVQNGISMLKMAHELGYKACPTAVYTTSQAAMWKILGADYLAVYINRMEHRGFNVEKNLRSIFSILNSTVKLLGASIKNVSQFSLLLDMNIDAVTLSYEMFESISRCEFSMQDVEKFDRDFADVVKHFESA